MLLQLPFHRKICEIGRNCRNVELCIKSLRNIHFQAWVGHPYVDIVDNRMDFETKIKAVIGKVASSIGIDIGDRLTTGARKLKFVINGPLPTETVFPDGFRDFEVSTFWDIL